MAEFITGITNLVMLLGSAICALLYRGYQKKTWWLITYGAVGVTSVLGTLVHLLTLGTTASLTLWAFVYAALSAILGALTLAMLATINKLNKYTYALAAGVAALTFALMLTFKLTQGIFSYIAVIIGAIVPVFLVFCLSTRDLVKNKNKKVWFTFVGIGFTLLLTVIFAFVKFSVPVGRSEFNQGALMHIVIGGCMIFIALGTRSMLPKEEKEQTI